MENVVKSGTVYRYHRGVMVRRGDSWKKCNATLVETENDGLLKLESDSEKTLTYSMQHCSRVLEAGNRYSRDNVIELLLQKKILQLGFDSPNESSEWLRVLSSYSKDSLSSLSSAPNPKTRQTTDVLTGDCFSAQSPDTMEYNVAYELDATIPPLDVTIRTSPLAEKLNLRGKFFLVINNDKLTIHSAENKTITFSWEYKTIRKYGRDKKSFSMEVGRRSPTGPGVLVFNTVYGNDIFHRVQKNTIAINSQPAAAAANPAQTTKQLPSRGITAERSNMGKARNNNASSKNDYHNTAGNAVPEADTYATIEDSLAARSRKDKHSVKREPEEQQYCKAEEITEDAWKKHGRVEENVHTEFYIGMPKKHSLQTNSLLPEQDQLYGQIRKRSLPTQRGGGGDLKQSDQGVYSSLGQSGISQHLHHVPPQSSYPSESTYDHLARPMTSPTGQSGACSPPILDQMIASSNGSEYDHLQRGMTSPQPPEAAEDLYNVIDRPRRSIDDSRGQKLVNLVDDGSGYMTNAGTAPPVPEENEYDMAIPHGYS